MPETMTIAMIARRFGVTQPTIYNWIKTGRFTVAPIEETKPRRWRTIDIDAWLNSTGKQNDAM